MDQNHQLFEAYVLGSAAPAGFVVYQGFVIPLPVYQVLRLANIQAPPSPITFKLIAILNCASFWEEMATISRCGLKKL